MCVGTDEATVLSVPSRDESEDASHSDEVESSDDDDNNNNIWGSDRCSAFSCNDDDFETENICWDHFGVVDGKRKDKMQVSREVFPAADPEVQAPSSAETLKSCLRRKCSLASDEGRPTSNKVIIDTESEWTFSSRALKEVGARLMRPRCRGG